MFEGKKLNKISAREDAIQRIKKRCDGMMPSEIFLFESNT